MISTDDDKRLSVASNALADAILRLCSILRNSPTLNYQSDTAKALDDAERLAHIAQEKVSHVNRGTALGGTET